MILSKTSFFKQIANFLKIYRLYYNRIAVTTTCNFSNFRLMIWDTAGQEEFDAITR